jgi:hypothetical protein
MGNAVLSEKVDKILDDALIDALIGRTIDETDSAIHQRIADAFYRRKTNDMASLPAYYSMDSVVRTYRRHLECLKTAKARRRRQLGYRHT